MVPEFATIFKAFRRQCCTQLFQVGIKIEQKDKTPYGIASHSFCMILKEFLQHPSPAIGYRQYVDGFLRNIGVGQKSIGDLPISIMLRKHTDVRTVFIAAHGVISSVSRALISCPLKCWRYFRSSMIKWLTSDSARYLSGSSQKQKTVLLTALAAITRAAIKRHFSPSDKTLKGRFVEP
jgi:hypothetical protein